MGKSLLSFNRNIPPPTLNVWPPPKKKVLTQLIELLGGIADKDKTEEQKSSGIIVSTGAGSNAWLRSAGVKPFSSSKKFYFIVREPYTGKLTKPLLTKGFIGYNNTIKIKSEMDNGIAAVDSNKEYRFKKGSVIEITISKNPVRLVRFK